MQRIGVLATMLVVLTLALAGWGCGGVYYAVNANTASARVEEARTLGAEQLAPYEYYYAREHLVQAQLEASAANYSDAAYFAEVAEEYAGKAVDVARASRRNASARKP
jgi:Domain of unknown function (DUF4398)